MADLPPPSPWAPRHCHPSPREWPSWIGLALLPSQPPATLFPRDKRGPIWGFCEHCNGKSLSVKVRRCGGWLLGEGGIGLKSSQPAADQNNPSWYHSTVWQGNRHWALPLIPGCVEDLDHLWRHCFAYCYGAWLVHVQSRGSPHCTGGNRLRHLLTFPKP